MGVEVFDLEDLVVAAGVTVVDEGEAEEIELGEELLPGEDADFVEVGGELGEEDAERSGLVVEVVGEDLCWDGFAGFGPEADLVMVGGGA